MLPHRSGEVPRRGDGAPLKPGTLDFAAIHTVSRHPLTNLIWLCYNPLKPSSMD